MNQESAAREQVCEIGASLHQRGLSPGTSGNISVRLSDGWLMTPTNSSLGHLNPRILSRLDAKGSLAQGDPPTKEALLHLAFYGHQPRAAAIIHLHATHSAAVSCLDGLDADNCLPPLTAYHVLKVGRLPLIPYHPPGDPDLVGAIGVHAADVNAMLLANHGPLVCGTSLASAAATIEELEETAKLFLLLRGSRTRPLPPDEVSRLTAPTPTPTQREQEK
ncbi:3-oxo-tetronate 4-phosphate decarboxylase [Mycolicibacterium goodii]|uniref:3-oxo-tetronate 4-phosphate decarboxylase n=1 Tax=Mycolicibacterium goodii TaxID=134601 RepID=A0A0K0X125_MYCGD|nr:aldolase [Mycolicibacterium goodii]